MQPYFLPYIGYWQLMASVDVFVVYDNIQYTKKGWINRNRFLLNGKAETFSLPLKKDSDFLHVSQRHLADGFALEKPRLIRRFESAYRNGPCFEQGMEVLDSALAGESSNLFEFIYQSIVAVRSLLGITSVLVTSSSFTLDPALKGQDRVIALCQALRAERYINPIGGMGLYDRDAFAEKGIELGFQQVRPYCYEQFGNPFVPHLSIVDAVMFKGLAGVRNMLPEMDVV